jgi:hypothetical protein
MGNHQFPSLTRVNFLGQYFKLGIFKPIEKVTFVLNARK